ncbi:hypothetical protein FCV25MIE_18987 [Fagus crenata]
MPLKSGIFLPKTGHDDLWIGLKSEKLLECCFNSVMLGHLAKDCNVPPDSLSNQFGVRFPTFGEWLNTDNACTPPGIYEKKCLSPMMVDLTTSQSIMEDQQPKVFTQAILGLNFPNPMMLSTCSNPSNPVNIGSHSTTLKDTNNLGNALEYGGVHEVVTVLNSPKP